MAVQPMRYLIKGGRVIDPASSVDMTADVYLRDGYVEAIEAPGKWSVSETHETIDARGLVVCPGLVDMHVHFREPGDVYKEDIASGAAAAALGGVTTACCMPNTKPPVDSAAQLLSVLARVAEAAIIKVRPIAALSEGQRGERLTDVKALYKAGAVAFSDDGSPVVSDALMRDGLLQVAALGGGAPLLSHCEPETEMAQRDIALAEETRTHVHICHVSKAATVDVIRKAKERGVNVTCETCPHYFWFTREDFERIGANAKMNPPLAEEADRRAVWQGVVSGVVDVIATDHAPHHPTEKSGPVRRAPNGVIGLETLLSASLTALDKEGGLSLSELLRKLTARPADILGVKAGRLRPGLLADVLVFDPDASWKVEASRFASKAKNSPFDGLTLRGRVLHVWADGIHVVQNAKLVKK